MCEFLRVRVIVVSVVALAAIFLAFPSPAHAAAPADLTVGLRSGPRGPLVVLTNPGTEPCQVSATTLGTVTAVRVTQGGRVVEPRSADVTFIESLDLYLASSLRVLEPGRSVELPLSILDTETGPALETVAWAGTTGSQAWLHPIDRAVPVELEIGYDVPVAPAGGPPLCGAGTGSGTVSAAATPERAGRRIPVVMIAGGAALVVVALGVLLLLLLRARRKRAASVVAVVVGLALLPVLGPARPARADIIVAQDPALQEMWRQCESVFRSPGGDPAGIMPILDDPDTQVHIGHTGVDLSKSVHRRGRTDITWNWDVDERTPTEAFGPGGKREPCPTLYHELFHAARYAEDGPPDRSWCYTKESNLSGVEVSEVEAVRAENLMRIRLGLPPRVSYNGFPIPQGECTEPENPRDRGMACGNLGCGYTTGDPHLRTFDGRHYAFQAVGEFVLTRDGRGGLQIQTRQAPMTMPKMRTVSINTAVVFDVAGDRVELRHTKSGLELLVAGAPRSLGPIRLPAGGSVDVIDSARGEMAEVTWPDGSVAQARYGARAGITLTVAVAEHRRGQMVGLLGDFDGDRANDLRGTGDRVIAEPTFEALYPGYADQWRVAAATSLFSYPAGTGPESYVDRSFPDREPDRANLANRSAAEQVCRSAGVLQPEVLADCVLDVALTGQPDFAYAAVVSQSSTGVATVDGPPVGLGVIRAGDTARLTFAGRAGQTVAVRVSQATVPAGCGVLRLLDPDGTSLADGCVIDTAGGLDPVRLPVDGQYTVVLDPTGDRTGAALIAVNSVADVSSTIRANAAPVTVTIGQPAAVARLFFPGVPGQVVVVGLGSSTWPSQCAMLSLLGPDGKELRTGCIVDGAGGIDAVRLPSAGSYTIVVDPRDDLTGTAQVVLSSVTGDSNPLTPNGPAATASVGTPGGAALFTFAGQAGQEMTVEVTGSTMPPSCGHIKVLDPDGQDLRPRRWCVIGGQGTISATLPGTGRYTLVFDPAGAGTGTAQVRLRTT